MPISMLLATLVAVLLASAAERAYAFSPMRTAGSIPLTGSLRAVVDHRRSYDPDEEEVDEEDEDLPRAYPPPPGYRGYRGYGELADPRGYAPLPPGYRGYAGSDEPRGYHRHPPARYGYDAPPLYRHPPPYTAYLPPPVPVPPPAYYGYAPERPSSCGQFRYWDGERCVDARRYPPYIGPKW